MRRLLLSILVVMLVASPSLAATIYVSPSGSNTSPYETWAKARTTLPTSGLSAGDTVYIDGGPSGITYNTDGWTPAAGTKANPVTYRVGQDSGHDGMVTFHGSGGDFVSGNLSGITINGSVGSNRRMTVEGSYAWTVYSDGDNTDGFKLLYVNLISPIWARGTGYEFAYNSMIAPAWGFTDDSYIAHIGEGSGGNYTANLFHHNYVQVNRIRNSGYGQDLLKWPESISIYNNYFIAVYNASYTGSQHGDGIQAAGYYTAIYNNYYENFISYPIFLGDYSNPNHVRIYNNVIKADESGVDWTAYQAMAIGPRSGAGNSNDIIIANNTIVGGSNRRGITLNVYPTSTCTSCYVVNNIVYSSDTIVEAAPGVTTSNNVGGTSGLAFVNNSLYPSGDFHLTSSATAAIDQGISPSYLTSIFNTDKDGIVRPMGSAWDVGAYEYGGTGPPTSPTIGLTVSTLYPSCVAGNDASSQTFQIYNSGGTTLSYTVADDAAWLVESPTSGTSSGEYDTITVNYSTASLAAGSYSATITVTASGATNTPQTISVSLTVNPSGGGTGNNFAGDSNCKALWKFESGALTTDSKSTNTLTNGNGVVADVTNKQEAYASAAFSAGSTQYMLISDANLVSGFPLKSSESNKTISVAMWIRLGSLPGSDLYVILFGKWNTVAGKRTFFLGAKNDSTGANCGAVGTCFRLATGYNTGGSAESHYHQTLLSAGTWYHVTFTYQDSDKTWAIRVRDTSGATLGTDATGTGTNAIYLADSDLTMGADCIGETNQYDMFSGNLDEVVVFSDVITSSEATQLAQHKYGGGSGMKINGLQVIKINGVAIGKVNGQ